MMENILENKIREVLFSDNITSYVNDRINKLNSFLLRLDKMDHSLSLEFLEFIDELILSGDINKIICNDNDDKTKIIKFNGNLDI